MKTSFFKLLFISILCPIFLAASCSNDDDGSQNNTPPFDPVTIDLTNLNVEVDDTSFEVQGFSFQAFRAECTPEGTFPGIGLYYPQDDNASYIELDLSELNGLSIITARIFVNSQTPIKFYNGNQVVDEIIAVNNSPGIFEDTAYDLNGQTVTSVRISSYESIVESITLE